MQGAFVTMPLHEYEKMQAEMRQLKEFKNTIISSVNVQTHQHETTVTVNVGEVAKDLLDKELRAAFQNQIIKASLLTY